MTMSPETDQGGPSVSGARWFPTTRWTTVLAAGSRDGEGAADALEQLCRTYWQPLYACIRRRGYPADQAEDLIQGFFARFLAHDHVVHADRNRGRLRSYLLGALNHYLADEADHRNRIKRGAGQPTLSLDVATGEAGYLQEPADNLSPDRLFERRWAITLLTQVLRRLEAEYATGGNDELFTAIKGFLTGDEEHGAYGPLAARLNRSEGALRVAVHRMRRRYAELLREELARVVADPAEIEEELRHLATVLSG
jgi:RNA polymerase sigma-70 factor (ECF subfamily)